MADKLKDIQEDMRKVIERVCLAQQNKMIEWMRQRFNFPSGGK